ncbi:MAG: efflux transporter outer membrane subunit [Chlorobium sp.]|nr:MAG: efflux transporter outer membrane subunit [Chlorobium sp.]
MKIRIHGLLQAIMLTLVGCGMIACSGTRESTSMDGLFPANYRGSVPAVSGVAADTVIAKLPYRRFFADQTLCVLIDSAIVKNIDLQVALKNIDYARQTLDASKLGILPALNVKVDDIRNYSSDNGARKTPQEYIASLSASWEVDIWGKIRSKKKSELASYLKTHEAANAVRTRLVADVAEGYYNLQMLDAQLATSRKSLALADTTLKMIQIQYAAGQVNDLAVKQQEASKQSIAGSIPLIEQNIVVQENALSILCGRMPGPVLRSQSFFNAKVADNLPVGIPAAMLQNRPDVRAAELAVRGANADVDQAGAAFYPSLTVTAQGGVSALHASDWFLFPGSIFGMVQGTLLQPLFQRGQLKADYEKSTIKRDQAELAFKQAVLKAVAEVSDALVRLEKIKEQEVIAEGRVVTLKKAVSNAGMLFQSGMATYLEVIVVQNNELSAELNLADIRRQHLASMAELYRSLGGGWRQVL